MQVLQEVFELEGERLWTVASGFGGGVARNQSLCGAISGGVIALGLLEGRSAKEVGPKTVSVTMRPKVDRLIESFRQAFGAIECRDLTKYDFKAPGGYELHSTDPEEKKSCRGYVRFVAEALAMEYGR